MIMAFVGLVMLAVPGNLTGVGAAAVFYCCFILDCVDGNVARLRQSVSYYGKFLDGISDSVFVWGAPVAAGIALWLQGQPDYWLLVAFVSTMASVANQGFRSRLSFFREWMVGQSGDIEPGTIKRLEPIRRVQTVAASVLVNGTFLTPLLLVIPAQGRELFLMASVVFLALPEIVWLASTMFEAKIILARPRRSVHSLVDPSEKSKNAV